MPERIQKRGKEETRRRLLGAAHELFYGNGICATGVSAVAERAGVTKMTLYAHFPSKDELVAAYLEDRDRRWREFLENKLSEREEPRERLLAVCEAYREYFMTREMRGCAFVNGAAELPDLDHPARQVIRRNKAGMRERLRELATETVVEDPGALAEHLFLLLEGAYVVGALEGSEEVLDDSCTLFTDLIDAAVGYRNRL